MYSIHICYPVVFFIIKINNTTKMIIFANTQLIFV